MTPEIEVDSILTKFHWRYGIVVYIANSYALKVLNHYAGKTLSDYELRNMEPKKLLKLLRSAFDIIFNKEVFNKLELPYRKMTKKLLCTYWFQCSDIISDEFRYARLRTMKIIAKKEIDSRHMQVYFDVKPWDWKWKYLRKLVETVWKKTVSRVWFFYSDDAERTLGHEVFTWKTKRVEDIVKIECNDSVRTFSIEIELPLNTIKRYYLAMMLGWYDAIDKAEELVDELASSIKETEKFRHDKRELELEWTRAKKRACVANVQKPADTLELEL